ncbi:MAG: PP2C family serine/threonine-protein phosphatase [Planctomycetaceae bacterium]
MRTSNEETLLYPSVQDFGEAFFAPAEPAVPIVFGAASHVGRVRSRNEDHFAVIRMRRTTDLLLASLGPEDLAVPEACSYTMVVADGMGGMKSGELASRLALQTMLELAGRATSWVMRLTDLDAQQIQQRVEAYVQRIHAALQEEGQSDPAKENMGTTWTSAHFLGRNAIVVHLGDSRAYHVRNGRLRQITHDETMAQSFIDAGMEPESVRKFGHILLNSFGGGNQPAVARIHHLEFDVDDQLLLCSDGLTDMVSPQEIAEELFRPTAPQAACDALVSRALANGGKDNVTVVLASAAAASV